MLRGIQAYELESEFQVSRENDKIHSAIAGRIHQSANLPVCIHLCTYIPRSNIVKVILI